MAQPQDFYTVESLLQVGGATAIVTLFSNGARYLSKSSSPWWPAGVSLIVSVISAGIAGKLPYLAPEHVEAPTFFHAIAYYTLVVANALLLFFGALGINETGRGLTSRSKAPRGRRNADGERVPLPFFAPYFGDQTTQPRESARMVA